MLFADPEGVCYKALGFHPGFASGASLSPYLKLLVMLAGIGSPGTIQEVSLLTQLLNMVSSTNIDLPAQLLIVRATRLGVEM